MYVLKLTSVKPIWGFLIRFCKQLLRVLVSSKLVDFLSISSISVELKKKVYFYHYAVHGNTLTAIFNNFNFFPAKGTFDAKNSLCAFKFQLLQVFCDLADRTPFSLTKLSINWISTLKQNLLFLDSGHVYWHSSS